MQVRRLENKPKQKQKKTIWQKHKYISIHQKTERSIAPDDIVKVQKHRYKGKMEISWSNLSKPKSISKFLTAEGGSGRHFAYYCLILRLFQVNRDLRYECVFIR